MTKKKKAILIIAAVLLVLVISATIILSSKYFFGAPLFKLLFAVKNTAQSKSLTVTVESEGEAFQFLYETSNKKQVYLIKNNNGTSVLEKNTEYYARHDNSYGYKDAMSRTLRTRIEIHNKLINKKNIDISEVLEAFFHISTDLDNENSKEFTKRLYREVLTNEAWLKEYAGYIKNGNTYSFTVENKALDYILNMANDTGVLSKTEASLLPKLITESFKIVLTLQIQNNTFTYIELSVNEKPIKITITDRNSTVLNKETLNDIKSRATELD